MRVQVEARPLSLDPVWRLFVLEAQVALSEAPDLAQTLKRGAQLCVSRLADWCVIFEVTGPERALQRAAAAHVDLRLEPALEAATQSPGAPPAAGRGAAEVARTGVPELQAVIPDLSWLAEGLGVPRSLDLERLGTAHSWACLPMRVDGEVVGVAALVSTQSPGCLRDAEELERAQQVVDMVARAAAKARRYEQAVAASQAREEFLLVAAHELRTPLTALHLNIQSLARLVDRQAVAGNERLRSGLTKALRQCSSFEGLIETLLDGAATRSGHLELERQEVDLGELVEQVTAQLEVELAHAGCAVERCFEALVTGSWDRSRLEQVVVNLLTNAMKYAPGRPIELRVEARGERARLEVRDHGAGIPSDQRQRIFERFERGSPSSRRQGGWGLGLYIVRQIVEAHGGTVEVHGAPSPGAVFVVELPREGRRS